MKRLLFIHIIILFSLFGVKANTKRHSPIINNNFQTLTPPEFPGGEKAFSKYLNKNLKWPDKDMETNEIVIISFFVEKDGYLTGFKVTKSLGKVFDDEALRVIMNSPRWIPAMRNNKPIKSKYSVPIRFFLSE